MSDSSLPSSPLNRSVDLTNCDREPIHTPGAVQNRGALIAIEISSGRVVAASANCEDVTGLSVADLLENPFRETLPVLGDIVTQAREMPEGKHADRRTVELPAGTRTVLAHHYGGRCLVEVLTAETESDVQASDLVGRLFVKMERQSLEEIYDCVVQTIQEFTGFDRVMLYQFLEDGHGCVIAEAKQDEQEAFLGLHYPASDIPAPARRLYELNRIRLIADVEAPTVDMVSAGGIEPVDMSFATLRAISPIHVEYLKNMGVRASMSISVMQGEKLWGLIACHHNQAKPVSPGMRDACELAGALLSTFLVSRMQQEQLQRKVEVNRAITENLSSMGQSNDVTGGLERSAGWLCSLFDACGMVWQSGSHNFFWGELPNQEAIRELHQALAVRPDQAIAFTDQISAWLPAAASYADRCAGMLAIRLGRREGGVFLFFRPPYSATITWGGDPSKSATREDGRLTPRKSFGAFQEKVEGKSRPWTQADREVAATLAAGMKTIFVEQAEQLRKAIDELRALNADLDAFAYAASHDLKEPLRGINHFAYLLEQAQNLTDENYVRGLQGVKRLTSRMEELLNGLLRFSRAGRAELRIEKFALAETVEQMQDVLFGGLPPEDVEISVESDGPVTGDFACVREILGNLASNAIKYNESEIKRVEIGMVPASETPLATVCEPASSVIYVNDNGIGIDPAFSTQIFEIFRRLHDRDAYGGGAGAGLTIVRRMVERHGGSIVAESTELGTTFYFTLGQKS
ncbi:ATP-binding protein [Rubinisphaera margarita]|uniref:ATP-binding protein n=1 Tax=Rubinisphaera margarita TaxID=2909586 RepID=UPI001EE8CCD0|nr:ATP-binding protein [Rubinisphaera margarita]MCG6156454.1 GAF domain-containing protein [Rubinisphaera margarita]